MGITMRAFTVAALGTLLAGCAGFLPPKPLPDWAMYQQAQPEKIALRKSGRAIAASREGLRQSNARLGASATEPLTTGSIRNATPRENSDELPFGKEWYAREEAADARLRRSMNICTGC
jgi:hypothetical protein